MGTEEIKQPKRKYESPRLIVHGTVEQITQTGKGPTRERSLIPGSKLWYY